ncbi:methionyl-tRNA formyltransferase [Erysipelothrix piscisicarius]|uniref:methionyl-tRNA formyltransferase n=1 Tax=Erysipelothrix piscisicarius TaxID=2485784 RepID=UPI002F9468CA
MRVMFMGTTHFSCVVLQQLLDDGYDVVAVVTQPDRPFGRKKVLKAPPVKELALKHEIPVIQPIKIKESIEDVLKFEPDLVVTCAYGQIVPKAILDYPKFLCLNVHASLLPKYRGGAPIHWSIIRGEKETGVTLMRMDVGMDSGDMLASRRVSIDDHDMMGDVESKLMAASKILIQEDLRAYLEGDLSFVPQNKEHVTLAYTIQREDEFVSFNRSVFDVYNHIRGLIPWPVGYGVVEGMNVKFHGVTMSESSHSYAPGEVISVDESGLTVACVNGSVTITLIQPAGKPITSAHDFANGLGRNWKGNDLNERKL